MKKIIITLIGLSMIICFASTASAWSSSNGADLSIADTTGGTGATLDYTPSPGTDLVGACTDTLYTIAGCNRKADDDGIIYMMISGTANVYQKPQAANSDGSMPSFTPSAGTTSSGFVARN